MALNPSNSSNLEQLVLKGLKHIHLCLTSVNVSKHFSSASLFLTLFS